MSRLVGCIGHILVAMSSYSWMSVMTWAAAEIIWSVVVVSLMSKAVVVCTVFCVVSFPNRYRSIRLLWEGSMNGGWLLVVGFG